MKLVIFGSRTITNIKILEKAILLSGVPITSKDEIISGGAKGVDALAIEYAKSHNIPFTVFPADWELHGKRAGFIRNATMATYADFGIALWDGESTGTKDMIHRMKNRCHVFFVITHITNGESSEHSVF